MLLPSNFKTQLLSNGLGAITQIISVAFLPLFFDFDLIGIFGKELATATVISTFFTFGFDTTSVYSPRRVSLIHVIALGIAAGLALNFNNIISSALALSATLISVNMLIGLKQKKTFIAIKSVLPLVVLLSQVIFNNLIVGFILGRLILIFLIFFLFKNSVFYSGERVNLKIQTNIFLNSLFVNLGVSLIPIYSPSIFGRNAAGKLFLYMRYSSGVVQIINKSFGEAIISENKVRIKEIAKRMYLKIISISVLLVFISHFTLSFIDMDKMLFLALIIALGQIISVPFGKVLIKLNRSKIVFVLTAALLLYRFSLLEIYSTNSLSNVFLFSYVYFLGYLLFGLMNLKNILSS